MKCPKCKTTNLMVRATQRSPYNVVTCSSRSSGSTSFKILRKFRCNECRYEWEK